MDARNRVRVYYPPAQVQGDQATVAQQHASAYAARQRAARSPRAFAELTAPPSLVRLLQLTQLLLLLLLAPAQVCHKQLWCGRERAQGG